MASSRTGKKRGKKKGDNRQSLTPKHNTLGSSLQRPGISTRILLDKVKGILADPEVAEILPKDKFKQLERSLVSQDVRKAKWLRELEVLKEIRPALEIYYEKAFLSDDSVDWMQHIDLKDIAKGPKAYDATEDAGMTGDTSFIQSMAKARAFIETALNIGEQLDFSLYEQLHSKAMEGSAENEKEIYTLNPYILDGLKKAGVDKEACEKLRNIYLQGEKSLKYKLPAKTGLNAFSELLREKLGDQLYLKNEEKILKQLNYANRLHPNHHPSYGYRGGQGKRINPLVLESIMPKVDSDHPILDGMTLNIVLGKFFPTNINEAETLKKASQPKRIQYVKDQLKGEGLNDGVLLEFSYEVEEKLKARLERYFQEYRDEVDAAKKQVNFADHNPSIILAIAKLHQRLERSHPYKDGNGRTHLALMNALLKKEGLTLVILDDPSSSHLVTAEDWAFQVERGQRRYIAVQDIVEKNLKRKNQAFSAHRPSKESDNEKIWDKTEGKLFEGIAKVLTDFDARNKVEERFRFKA